MHYGHAPPSAMVVGNDLVIMPGFQFPWLCVKCGKNDGTLVVDAREYSWFPAWTYVFLLGGLIPGALIQAIMTKRATLHHPLCASCKKRWTMARVAWTLSVVLPIVIGLGGMFLGVAIGTGGSGNVIIAFLILMLVGIFVAPITVKFTLVNPRTLKPTNIADNGAITLNGVAPEVLSALQHR